MHYLGSGITHNKYIPPLNIKTFNTFYIREKISYACLLLYFSKALHTGVQIITAAKISKIPFKEIRVVKSSRRLIESKNKNKHPNTIMVCKAVENPAVIPILQILFLKIFFNRAKIPAAKTPKRIRGTKTIMKEAIGFPLRKGLKSLSITETPAVVALTSEIIPKDNPKRAPCFHPKTMAVIITGICSKVIDTKPGTTIKPSGVNPNTISMASNIEN